MHGKVVFCDNIATYRTKERIQDMAAWQNFYLQRMGTDSQGNTYPMYESVAAWGVWCKDIPFKIFDKVKEPAKRSWNDEHGDDEYISSDGLWLDSYEMDVEFGCKKMPSNYGGMDTAAVGDVRVAVGVFLEYLRESGMMKLYSAWTRTGRQEVRLVSVSDDAHWEPDEGDGSEFLVFKVRFKVNDPKTDVVL